MLESDKSNPEISKITTLCYVRMLQLTKVAQYIENSTKHTNSYLQTHDEKIHQIISPPLYVNSKH